jgi:hypothetical protein
MRSGLLWQLRQLAKAWLHLLLLLLLLLPGGSAPCLLVPLSQHISTWQAPLPASCHLCSRSC